MCTLFIFSLIVSILQVADGPALVIKCHTDTACYMSFDKGSGRDVTVLCLRCGLDLALYVVKTQNIYQSIIFYFCQRV